MKNKLNREATLEDVLGILEFVRSERGFDPTGYYPAVLATRVQNRITATASANAWEYLRRLKSDSQELDTLVASLTIKYSMFFRDPLAFEYLREVLLPALLERKASAGGGALRIWSAGCAFGEEAYSLAILLHELARQFPAADNALLFATDRDEQALAQAAEARYPAASLENVRHGLIESVFVKEGEQFRVIPAVARRVRFSVHDMLDRRSAAPAESVFGSFDLILCRNVLIYFEPNYQSFICEQLYRSLVAGGCLLLGRVEKLPPPWSGRFQQTTECCPVYRKPERSSGSVA